MNIKYLIGVLCLTMSLGAMEAPEGSSQVKLQDIAASSQLPQEGKIVQNWTNNNANLLKGLSYLGTHEYDKTEPFKPFTKDARSSMQRGMKRVLKARGIADKSGANYVFLMPGSEEYMIKVPGQINRWHNLVEYYALEVFKKGRSQLTKDETDKIASYFIENPSKTITYQGISRAIYADRFKKLFASGVLNNKLLGVSEVYLQKYPWVTDDTIINDDTFFVVEKVVKGTPVTKESFKTLQPEVVVELLKAAQYGYLWSIGYQNLILGNDGKLYVVDIEQPNRWYYGAAIEDNNKTCQLYAANGMAEVIKMAKDNPEQYAAIKTYMKTLDLDNSNLCKDAQNHLKRKQEYQEIMA